MKRKHIIWAGVTVVVVAGGLWMALAPAIVDVEAATVARSPMRVTVDEEGETRLRRRFVVSAPVSGRVLRIDIRPGDRVKAGQRIALIQPAAPTPLDARTEAMTAARADAAAAAAERARADRSRLAVERKQADMDTARARRLLDSGYGSQEAWEQSDARARSLAQTEQAADSAVRAAEFELAAAKAALLSQADAKSGREVGVTAPIAGLVMRRLQESEAVVPAGAPLVEVGTLDDLEIVADLLSTDAVQVTVGAPVVIERWGGAGSLSGCVQRVEPAGFLKISALGVEEQRVNVVIDFLDPRESRAALGDGYRVEVRIITWEKADALTVPTSSLFRLDGAWVVFAIEQDRLRRVAVKVGHRNEQVAEILEGLAEGARVVMYPGESLTEGARVRTRK